MTASVVGRLDWGIKVEDGTAHRDYQLSWLVQTDDVLTGPFSIMQAAGLPTPGSSWVYGTDNDPWAYCSPAWTASPVLKREPCLYWIVETPFTTKPFRKCSDESIENPMSEAPRISGSFTNYTEEAVFDKDGNIIHSSSWELFKGQENEWDASRPTVTIGLNQIDSPISLATPLMHCVNSGAMWGVSARCVKLSGCRWQRLTYGTCSTYYSVDYDFDINFNTFDRDLADVGTCKLKPGGDPTNPADFIVAKDVNHENKVILLNGSGAPATSLATVGKIHVKKYFEQNLFMLGIPSSL